MAKRRSTRERRNAALKAKRKAARETFADARARYRYGHPEFPTVALRAMIDAVTKRDARMPLSLRAAIAASRVSAFDAVWNELRRQGKAGKGKDGGEWVAARDRLLRELRSDPSLAESLWRRFQADCERALLGGDANWFERQAKAVRFTDVRSESEKVRARFEVAVLREYEDAAGVAPQDMPRHILDRLDKHEETRYGIRERGKDERYGGVDRSKKTKPLIVQGYRFSSARRCREAIKRIIARYHS